jgi:succinoglycan biosynthesis protein ExoA
MLSIRRDSASTATKPGDDYDEERVTGLQLRNTDHFEVLLVIPVLNEEDHLRNVLVTLLKQAAKSRRITLAVVDGGSTDRTVDIVRELQTEHANLKLLNNPSRIQSSAVNLAARTFGQSADVMIRCDAHATYPEHFISQLLLTLVNVEADSVVVPMVSTGTSRLQSVLAWLSNSKVGTGGSAHRGLHHASGFVDHGHHAAFRMTSFRKVGGYDETFTHNEDAEFDCRLRAMNGRIYLDTSNYIEYVPRATARDLGRQYFQYGAGRSRTVRRHPSSLRLRQLVVVLNLLLLAVSILLAPLSLWALAWPVLYVLALTGAAVQLSIRHGSAWALLAAPLAMVMHVSWALGFVVGIVLVREPPWQPAAEQTLS